MASGIRFLIRNKALNYPQFRKFLVLRFTLIMALNMQTTIVNYWMYSLTHSKISLGKLGLAEAIPAIFCSLFSGHFVDHREKRNLLLVCVGAYLLLGAFFVCIAFPSFKEATSAITVEYLIYAGIFIGGIIRAFVSPTTFSLLGLLLPKRIYPNATTWSSTAWQIGAVVGPLFGGLMIGFTGVRNGLLTGTCLLVIPFIAAILIPVQPLVEKVREPMLKSLKQGLQFVFQKQVILAALSLDMFAVLFGGAVALLPVYAQDILKVNELGYGWLRAAPGIGSLITLGILSFVPLKSNPGLKLLACIAGFGVTTIVFGLCGDIASTDALATFHTMRISWAFLLAFAMMVVGGMFDAVSVVIRGTILQVFTPSEMRGRVSAVNTMFVSSSNELGEVESGYTAHWFGTVPAVVVGGFLTLAVVGVTYFAAPALRGLSLDDKPAEPKAG